MWSLLAVMAWTLILRRPDRTGINKQESITRFRVCDSGLVMCRNEKTLRNAQNHGKKRGTESHNETSD